MIARLRTSWDRLSANFVDNWQESLRWGSVRLHILATSFVVPLISYMAQDPSALKSLVAQLPPHFPLTSVLVTLGGIWLILGWMIRVWGGKHL